MLLWYRQESCALSSPLPSVARLSSSYPCLISGMLLCWWIADAVQSLDLVNTETKKKKGQWCCSLIDKVLEAVSFLLPEVSHLELDAIGSSFGITSSVDYEEMSCWCRSWADFFFVWDFLFRIHSQRNTLFSTDKSRAQRIFLPFISSIGYWTPDLTLKIDFCWNLMLCNSFLLLHGKTEGRSTFFPLWRY